MMIHHPVTKPACGRAHHMPHKVTRRLSKLTPNPAKPPAPYRHSSYTIAGLNFLFYHSLALSEGLYRPRNGAVSMKDGSNGLAGLKVS